MWSLVGMKKEKRYEKMEQSKERKEGFIWSEEGRWWLFQSSSKSHWDTCRENRGDVSISNLGEETTKRAPPHLIFCGQTFPSFASRDRGSIHLYSRIFLNRRTMHFNGVTFCGATWHSVSSSRVDRSWINEVLVKMVDPF